MNNYQLNKYNFFLESSDRQWKLWLLISLIFPLAYGLLALQQAFNGEWIVQDDARQHVFWMLRFSDPELFPNDLIADYFQSVAPQGYKTLYQIAAWSKLNPLVFNKILPLIIALVSSYYFFLLCRQIFPVPLGCFIATLLFNQNIWLEDDIISGTPRAFFYPFFIAFLYYLVEVSLFFCVVNLLLLGLFYPQGLLLSYGILIIRLVEWRSLRIRLSNSFKNHRYFYIFSLMIAFLILLTYALSTSEFAPIITRSQAIQMPEFQYSGRASFFKETIWEYLIGKGRGTMLRTSLFFPYTLIFSLFLPLGFKLRLYRKITINYQLLIQILVVSLAVFFLAHILLFKLHLPARYTQHSLRIVIPIIASIVITSILDKLFSLQELGFGFKKILFLFIAITISLIIILYPCLVKPFPNTGYKIGSEPELYRFLQQQPKDIRIASLTKEIDNLPTFTRRSILVGREYAIPYHLGYYQLFSQRITDLIRAQYSNNLSEVKNFIRQYQVSFFLLENLSFNLDYVEANRWIRNHADNLDSIINSLQQGKIPILLAYKDRCQMFANDNYTVINSQCILNQTQSKSKIIK